MTSFAAVRLWVAFAFVLAAAFAAVEPAGAELEQTRDLSPATTGLDRPAGLPIRPIRLPRPPRLPPIRLSPTLFLPPVVLRPWPDLVGDLANARSFGLVEVPRAREALHRLYRRDRYKRLMVDAFCTAMRWLGAQNEFPSLTFSAADWRRYFTSYLDFYWRDHLRTYARPRGVSVADDWLGVWDMAEIDPGLAVGYYLACLRR